jgi:hypothetical protein
MGRSLRSILATSALLAACVCAACGSAGGAGSHAAPRRPAFVHGVRNPWFPLTPGTTFVYTGEKDGAQGRDVVRVTSRTKRIDGVTCTEVQDRLYAAGHLAERTKDWYAQDAQGNVWYFGESTAELGKSGQITSREGSWQSGVAGAKAGIFMPAHPALGQTFRQEYYKGHAEDHFAVVSLDASVVVPYTAGAHALLTKEWTPLEPGVLDHKLYVRGVGEVKEETIKGGDERWELSDLLHR